MSNKSRIHNSVKNISYGFFVTILNTLISFITRTVLVNTLGATVIGLNGLFTEVISMLSLAELGVGMAIVYSLYKPINEQNFHKISQLMSLYKKAYLIISFVTLLIGLLLTPFIQYLITGIDYPLYYIKLVFLLIVIKTSSTYLFSYKTSLLNADQKQYIVSIITVIVKLIITVVTIICLLLTRNYILYLILLIIQSIITNLIISNYVNNIYPQVSYDIKMDKTEEYEIFSNIKNIFIKRLSGVITSSTDNILISTIVSTVQVGYYSNYTLIFSMVRTLKQQFTNGIAASIGNLSVDSTKEHCVNVLSRLTYLYFIFGLIMCSGLMAVSGNFILIWIGKQYVMSDNIVFLAIFNLFLEICSDPLWQYLEVSGLFNRDKNIAIIGSVINLIISIFLGLRVGIIGILLGTMCTQLIQLVLKANLIFQYKFFQSPKTFYLLLGKILFSYFIELLCQCYLISVITFENIFIEIIVKGVVSVFSAVVIIIVLFFKSEEFHYSKQLMLKFLRKNLRQE